MKKNLNMVSVIQYTVNGKLYRVPSGIQKEIEFNFKELINLKSRGINLFFLQILIK